MKLSTKTARFIIFPVALLVTVTTATSLGIAQSAHAESLLDRVKQVIVGKKQTPAPTPTTSSTKVSTIISRGNAEITRRLQTLEKLTTLITSATHLTASDKTSLQAEVNSTISGLTALKVKLDADTSTTTAKTDAQSILTEYRVYALVDPKVHLIKLADDIQATDTKLTTLAGKLQTRITAAKAAGKDTSTLQTKLTDMNAQIAAGQNIAGNSETKIASLEPSDYNSDHNLLNGYSTQLKTARSDNQAADADAKAIVSTLQTL